MTPREEIESKLRIQNLLYCSINLRHNHGQIEVVAPTLRPEEIKALEEEVLLELKNECGIDAKNLSVTDLKIAYRLVGILLAAKSR